MGRNREPGPDGHGELRQVSRKTAAFLVTIAAALLLYFLYLFAGRRRAAPEPDSNQFQAAPGAPARPSREANSKNNISNPQGVNRDGDAQGEDGLQNPEIQAKRAERARRTLDSYKEWARYPPESRPLREHPDQIHAHYVAPSRQPISGAGQKLSDARIMLSQDRLYLVGEERAVLRMMCETSEGPAACEIHSAKAAVPAHFKPLQGNYSPSDVLFSADGSAEGALSAVFQPFSQGFAGYTGPIQIQIELSVAGESGRAAFELMYTPEAPALFTGKFREALEEGSLNIYAELKVNKPGRYVITARADGSDGKSFAYLHINDEIAEGKQEVKLQIFGKLIRDEEARSPFTLRDLEGYLLLENTYPDRELLAGMDGPVYTSKSYALREFSGEEWQSEEKERHLKEYQKDVDSIAKE